MKRYSMNAIGEARPNALGLWAEYSEVQALLRAVAEEVGKVRHEQSCRAHKRCKICDKPPWANDHRADIPSHHAHVFSPWGCDCPRGRALALLEAK